MHKSEKRRRDWLRLCGEEMMSGVVGEIKREPRGCGSLAYLHITHSPPAGLNGGIKV
jgi:hypothetical protein